MTASRPMALSNEELSRKARERMAAHRQTPKYREWLERSRELRRALKAKYRRQAGAKPRDPQAAAAKLELAQERRVLREALQLLHDAHVARYRRVMREREKSARQYAKDPGKQRSRSAARKLALPDSYVVEQLGYGGFPREAITEKVIELKREALQFRRLSRQVRAAISDQQEEQS